MTTRQTVTRQSDARRISVHNYPSHRHPMTFIRQETDSYFTLTSPKGKEIGVSFGVNVSVWIQRNGMSGLSMGRHFGSLAEAIDAYKSADVKAALSALDALA